MFKLLRMLFLSCVLLLTACGGGSSGGGGSGATYTGTFTANLSTGSIFVTDTGTFTAVVSGDNVVVTFEDGTEFSGEFSELGLASLTERSVVGVVEGCTSGTVSITITGRPDDGTISGILSGNGIVCDGIALSLHGRLKGNLVQ